MKDGGGGGGGVGAKEKKEKKPDSYYRHTVILPQTEFRQVCLCVCSCVRCASATA